MVLVLEANYGMHRPVLRLTFDVFRESGSLEEILCAATPGNILRHFQAEEGKGSTHKMGASPASGFTVPRKVGIFSDDPSYTRSTTRMEASFIAGWTRDAPDLILAAAAQRTCGRVDLFSANTH